MLLVSFAWSQVAFPAKVQETFFDINIHNIADLFLKPLLLWCSFSAETKAGGNWRSFFYSLASGFDQTLQVLSHPGMVSGCGAITAGRDRVALIQFEDKASKSS